MQCKRLVIPPAQCQSRHRTHNEGVGADPAIAVARCRCRRSGSNTSRTMSGTCGSGAIGTGSCSETSKTWSRASSTTSITGSTPGKLVLLVRVVGTEDVFRISRLRRGPWILT
eukprot:2632726-Rhodomonas_salina.2